MLFLYKRVIYLKTKAIIFDKDGTLIDFDAFWLTITDKALDIILEKLNRTDIPKAEFLTALGVVDGVTGINGVLCHGTYAQMFEKIHRVLAVNNCGVSYEALSEIASDAYKTSAECGIVRGTCDNIREFLLSLKQKGIILAVVTTDNPLITDKCLTSLNIKDLFDVIYTDDGKTPTKPDPYCAMDLCQKFNLTKDEIVMVGDTFTDVHFAKNAGIRVICVAKSETNRKILSTEADTIVHDISCITGHLN